MVFFTIFKQIYQTTKVKLTHISPVVMFKVSVILPIKVFYCCLIAFLFVGLSFESKAQEENSPRPIEKTQVEESGTTLQENISTSFPLFKPSSAKQVSPAGQVKRELTVSGNIPEKELKKNESPSTLSFNIFLYIVDKFREDSKDHQ